MVWLKNRFGYDDSLDAFGVHGVGGLAGALLTGVFATGLVNEAAADATLMKQLWGTAAVAAWSAVATFGILMVCRFTTGLRVSAEDEFLGLDLAVHGVALHDSV